jgi:SAM-dependent methyltransferase
LIPAGTILDLASGPGLMSRSFIEQGCTVTMIDILPEMCELAIRGVPLHLRDRVHVICADACSHRELEAGSFDAAVCTQALNFFETPEPLFQTAAFALKRGGLLYCDVDTAFRWAIIEALSGRVSNAQSIVSQGIDASRTIISADYFFHSQDRMRRALEAAGFELVDTFGLLYAAPFLRLFNQGSDFLTPAGLRPEAAYFTDPSRIEQLCDFEKTLLGRWPAESAGYQAYLARKD